MRGSVLKKIAVLTVVIIFALVLWTRSGCREILVRAKGQERSLQRASTQSQNGQNHCRAFSHQGRGHESQRGKVPEA